MSRGYFAIISFGFTSLIVCWILGAVLFVNGLSSRCFQCRSRGELGDCRDPFPYNDTSVKSLPGEPIAVTPCPSGWCSKQIEGIRGPPDDFGSATERACMVFAPSDGEERCAEVKLLNKPTLMCWCRGDLCNASVSLSPNYLALLALIFFSLVVTPSL